MRTLVGSGAQVSFGSDWQVSSHRPLEGIQVAVIRRTPTLAGGPSPAGHGYQLSGNSVADVRI
ncbi:hypothetical protein [Embleya sp. NPDC005575]|uniref:hypothetical protein n=1 Tax=Embleya sp. NPDC005575 TaxID=3156892 RepID=UPI0033A4BC3F